MAGAVIAYLYNEWLTAFPSRKTRRLYLAKWLLRMGEGCNIQMHCRFLNGRKVTFGNRVVINYGCMLDGRSFPVEIGDDVSMGPEASILTLGHDPQSPQFEDKGGPVVIGNRAWIGYRALILPGVTVGEGAVVAAGSVVSRDVEPFAIVAGVPARPVGTRPRDLSYELSFQPWLV